MNKRPLSVTIIGWLFVAVGTIGIVYHATEFKTPFEYDLVLGLLVRLLAIVAGLLLLRGHNWARWVLILWLSYHVILSAFHSFFQVAFHALLLAVIAYFLLRPTTAAYFFSSTPAAD